MYDMFSHLQVRLPFEHTVIGFARTTNNRTFVAWSRNDRVHPFGTHEVTSDGQTCAHGHYLATRSDAFTDLHSRAQGGACDYSALLSEAVLQLEELLSLRGDTEEQIAEATAHLAGPLNLGRAPS